MQKLYSGHNNKPFILKPAAKDYLWGGTRLNDEFSKDIPVYPLAETWECSTHPDGESVIASGEYNGLKLGDVLTKHPEYLGTHPLENLIDDRVELPILIKLIDANKDLSVQVHPGDEYAYEHENKQRGKAEMWYVLDATENATLVYGLQFDINQKKVRESVEDGTFEKYLQRVPVKRDDVFWIEPGVIHAIGAGALVAEIQENSNLTYRIYDYNRVDKNGERRELHIDKAMEVADLEASKAPRQSMRVLKYKRGCATELLGRCRYFEVYRMLLNTERTREFLDYKSDDKSFRVLLCVSGCGSMTMESGEVLYFFKGDCIFFPADSCHVKLHGKAQILDIRA